LCLSLRIQTKKMNENEKRIGDKNKSENSYHYDLQT
jgi:hypothetical protein